MRSYRNGILLTSIVFVFAGCTSAPDAPPMPTDGPNQVVLRVPGMS